MTPTSGGNASPVASEKKALERAQRRILELEQALAAAQQHPQQAQALYPGNPNEVFLEQSAKMAHLGYAVWDDLLDKDITVSEELARIHGFSLNDYLKTITSLEKYLELILPEDRQRYLKHDYQLLADRSSKASSVEYRIRRPDGEIRYIKELSQYIPVSSGQPTQSIVVLQDVTDVKRAELRLDKSREALQEREAMLTHTAAMAKLGHAIWNEDADQYSTVSESWAAIFGYSQEEFMTRFIAAEDDYELVHPEDQERYRSFCAEYRNSHEVPDIEYRIVRRDGATRHVLERHSYIFKDTGEPPKSLLMIQDITDRIEREHELRDARNAAEEALLAKSSFLALMSHEIRTPLNAVVGALGMIESGKIDPSLVKYLSLGIKGAENLLHIINDILDFSKMEAGKLQLESAPFSLRETIRDVLQVVEPRALEKNISLTWEIAPEVFDLLVGDAGRVQQVLLNLCSNAVRFTEEGGVHVRLTRPRAGDGSSPVRFEVQDTGSGVSQEDQQHLFEEFWGRNDGAAGGVGGTGLGLSICKQLVELMGGSIGFESEPGTGSVFWFELSLETVGNEAASVGTSGSQQSQVIASPEDLPLLQGRVLLAEDNSANQLIEEALLERLGLQVDVVGNGEEAVAALRDVPYDLVLMDINMPEMDGIQATAAIRNLPGAPASIPIIAMTAYAMQGDRERFLSQGMNGYVSKPIIRSELHSCLAKFLSKAGPAPVTAGIPAYAEPLETHTQVIDAGALGKLIGDVGAELLPQIIEAYLAEVPARVAAIAAAVAAGDCERVAREAHPLKSSSANLGATALEEVARRLEHAGRELNRDTVEMEAGRLGSLSEQTRDELLRISRDMESLTESPS
jgi:PAS domain S-box-containing protein